MLTQTVCKGMKARARMLGAWQWASVGVWSVSLSFGAGAKSSSVIKTNLSPVPDGKGRLKGWGGSGIKKIKKKGEIKARDGYFWWKGKKGRFLILARRAGLPEGENVATWMRRCWSVRRRSDALGQAAQYTHWHGIAQQGHAAEKSPSRQEFPSFQGKWLDEAFRERFVNTSAVTQMSYIYCLRK